MNGFELLANTDEQEKIILALAASDLSKEDFFERVKDNIKSLK